MMKASGVGGSGLPLRLALAALAALTSLLSQGCSAREPADNILAPNTHDLVQFAATDQLRQAHYMPFHVGMPAGTRWSKVSHFIFLNDGATVGVMLSHADKGSEKIWSRVKAQLAGQSVVPAGLLKCNGWVGTMEAFPPGGPGHLGSALWIATRPGYQMELLIHWPEGDAAGKDEAQLMAACALWTIRADG